MSTRTVARTTANMGHWAFKRQYADNNNNEELFANTKAEDEEEPQEVDDWRQLQWHPSAYENTLFAHFPVVIEQAKLPKKLLKYIKVRPKPLGDGGFGVVFKCTISLPYNRRLQRYVIKLSKHALLSHVYTVQPNGLITTAHTTADIIVDRARRNFKEEMQWFERIYEPTGQYKRFGGGQRARNVSLTELAEWQAEDSYWATHRGRPHIHVYVHYDERIPAIISEACLGTLLDLRMTQHPAWFFAPSPDKLPKAWYAVASQLANGVLYMLERGVAHGDLKLENVLVSENLVCKISDFGICYDKHQNTLGKLGGTEYYLSPRWPTDKIMFPANMTLYSLACMLAELVAFAEWPPLIKSSCFAIDAGEMIDSPFFCDPDELPKDAAAWSLVLTILYLNFARVVGDVSVAYTSQLCQQLGASQ
jgi:serine/threonine protein kinase